MSDSRSTESKRSAGLVAETADNLRFHHAKSSQMKLRTYVSFMHQAASRSRPRKVVARLECSLQSDAGEGTSTGMREEVDIRVVTSLDGAAKYLYEDVYCQRGQMDSVRMQLLRAGCQSRPSW
jgi:hypothetical protein